MRDELAERLFATVMGSDQGDDDDLLVDVAKPLQQMATYKYDEYGGYSPGVKFLESLAAWLAQFEQDERRVALDFVRSQLLFFSNAEIRHALSLAYADMIRPRLVRRCADKLGMPAWRVSAITGSDAFRVLQRSTMFLGLADGARLDQFRRANPDLVHDQFSVTSVLPDDVAGAMLADLNKQLAEKGLPGDYRFQHIVLVDDFSGSGYTALRRGDTGWEGKLAKVHKHLGDLKDSGIVDDNHSVQVLLYACTARAQAVLTQALHDTGWGWELRVVQQVPEACLIEEEGEFAELCRKYHDPAFDDAIKTGAASTTCALGFRQGRLPLILTHNTPNNSAGILWENSADNAKSTATLRGLFPRHERHKADR